VAADRIRGRVEKCHAFASHDSGAFLDHRGLIFEEIRGRIEKYHAFVGHDSRAFLDSHALISDQV
jgi:hypothetical protein